VIHADIDVKLHSRVWYDLGVIGKQSDTITTGQDNNFNGSFITNVGAQFTFKAAISEHLAGAMGIGVFQPASPQAKPVNGSTASASFHKAKIGFQPYVTQAKLAYFLGGKDSPLLKIEIGQFPYHYNKDNRNLGNYLFRGPVYPGFLTSGFHHITNEPTIANTTGLLVGTNLGNFHFDMIFKSETDIRPIFDWSLGAVASYNFGNVLEIGAGVNFYRIIASRSGNTDLTDESITKDIRGDPFEFKIKDPWQRLFISLDYTDTEMDSTQLAEWVATGIFPDGSTVDPTLFDTQELKNNTDKATTTVRVLSLDTTFLTFRGTKVMGRFSFDAKPLLGIEGGNDYKLYSEITLIGVKDYGAAYDNKAERMPIMFGINLPTFGFLDVFNIEVEWYGAKFRNDTYKMAGNISPSPLPMSGHPAEYNLYPDADGFIATRSDSVSFADYDPQNITSDDIKWSVFLSKTIRNHIDISFQIANDHYRPSEYFPELTSYATPFTEISDWYTAARIGYHF